MGTAIKQLGQPERAAAATRMDGSVRWAEREGMGAEARETGAGICCSVEHEMDRWDGGKSAGCVRSWETKCTYVWGRRGPRRLVVSTGRT